MMLAVQFAGATLMAAGIAILSRTGVRGAAVGGGVAFITCAAVITVAAVN